MFAKHLRIVIKPLIWILAGLYLLVDVISVVLLQPMARWVARVTESLRIVGWIRSLGPYASLALFLVPLILLEPAKLLSVLLIGIGHPKLGLGVLVTGEALKILVLERIFHITRPKLMAFRWFAYTYGRMSEFFTYLTSLPIVKAARVWMRRIRAYTRRLVSSRRARPA
jgi:hypothetical protein